MQVTYGTGFEVARPMRARVERLQTALEKLPQTDCPVRHYFAPGMYAREMTIPAGTVVVGAVHKTENLVIVSMGRLQIVTEAGTREVAAGETFTCRVGMKNAVVALEDSRWTNFLANPDNLQDVELLAEIYTESKACELLGGTQNKQLAAQAAESIEA